MKTNPSRICFNFYCQYWLLLYTYTVYEIYHDAFPSFLSHVTILIKHKLKEPFRKNYSATFYTYVEITEDLYVGAQHFKRLIQKAYYFV